MRSSPKEGKVGQTRHRQNYLPDHFPLFRLESSHGYVVENISGVLSLRKTPPSTTALQQIVANVSCIAFTFLRTRVMFLVLQNSNSIVVSSIVREDRAVSHHTQVFFGIPKGSLFGVRRERIRIDSKDFPAFLFLFGVPLL